MESHQVQKELNKKEISNKKQRMKDETDLHQ